jgi:hypothetical protein
VNQLVVPHQALNALADWLQRELATSSITVVRGWQAAVSEEPEAKALRAAGAGWDWVALGFAGCNFWDLHVGLLGGEDADGAWQASVGLHWRNPVDAVARPLAAEIASLECLHFAPLTGEYQQELPAASSTEDAARAAVELARHVETALTV